MPYRSSVWSRLTEDMLREYREVWRSALVQAVADARPDLVHANHLWLMSSLVPDAAAGVPSVAHCHATGLRQMELCPGLRDEVVAGLRRHSRFVVLHADHAATVAETLVAATDRVAVVGAGYREDYFNDRGAPPASERRGNLLYVGKYAAAKGLPWLLDACEVLWNRGDRFVLHVAGDGAGPEAEALRSRLQAAGRRVRVHGRLDQWALATVMRRCCALVLPSFYEGLPLVLAEARACGCRLVSTALPGVAATLAPSLGPDLQLVPPPRLTGPDTPVAADLPAFTERLAAELTDALAAGVSPPDPAVLEPFTWSAVFRRVEAIWRELVA